MPIPIEKGTNSDLSSSNLYKFWFTKVQTETLKQGFEETVFACN